jgi:putative ABC transport system substrate-binding protein
MLISRRRFVAMLGTIAGLSPTMVHAQNSSRVRTVGFLLGLADDAEARGRIQAFEEALKRDGWTLGQNIRVVYRYGAGDDTRIRGFAKELVELNPDVIVGHSTQVVKELVQATKKIPIVFVVVADPIGSGFAESFHRPGGNSTGFTNLDSGITGKMLTILKQIAPGVSAVALMFNPETAAQGGLFYWRPFEEAASAFGVKPIQARVRSAADIENVMTELGRQPGSGLILQPDNFVTVHRNLILSLAERGKIPAVYPYRYFAEAGGLMSYGVDVTDLFRRAPAYVGRILRGANPAELPIQAPTKFESVINLRTAQALKLTVPKLLLTGADGLIE